MSRFWFVTISIRAVFDPQLATNNRNRDGAATPEADPGDLGARQVAQAARGPVRGHPSFSGGDEAQAGDPAGAGLLVDPAGAGLLVEVARHRRAGPPDARQRLEDVFRRRHRLADVRPTRPRVLLQPPPCSTSPLSIPSPSSPLQGLSSRWSSSRHSSELASPHVVLSRCLRKYPRRTRWSCGHP